MAYDNIQIDDIQPTVSSYKFYYNLSRIHSNDLKSVTYYYFKAEVTIPINSTTGHVATAQKKSEKVAFNNREYLISAVMNLVVCATHRISNSSISFFISQALQISDEVGSPHIVHSLR